jgi:predicted RNA binding protein YcfA (HicA-like mRNA interferase family)
MNEAPERDAMTKPSKLYASLLANPRQVVAFREFEALLAAFGFVLDRTRGSHRQYVHAATQAKLTVNPDGKDAHPYQVRKLLATIAEHGLSIDA